MYFTLASLELRAAAPPFLLKYSAAEALPPTFIIRNWSHVHVSRLVDLVSGRIGDDVPHEGDVDTEISMDGAAVETDVDSKRH